MIRAFKVGAGWGFRRGRIVLVPYRTYTRTLWRIFYSSGGTLTFTKLETAWRSFQNSKDYRSEEA